MRSLTEVASYVAALTTLGVAAVGLTAATHRVEAQTQTPSVEVAPGSVARWSAPQTQTCHLDDRSWAARDDTCHFAIDLLRTGTLRAMRTFADGRYERLVLRVGDYPYRVQRLTIEDDSRVNLSQENLARVRRENARIGALWGRDTPPTFTLPLGPPLDPMPSGGRFGSKRIINGEPRSPHSGRDYSAGTGTPVLATAAGEVVLAEEHFFAGNSVFLDHGDGLISMSFHLSEILVQPGQRVERGEVIGKVGSTGRSTGPHLHLGFRWRGARVDPQLLLRDATLPSLP